MGIPGPRVHDLRADRPSPRSIHKLVCAHLRTTQELAALTNLSCMEIQDPARFPLGAR